MESVETRPESQPRRNFYLVIPLERRPKKNQRKNSRHSQQQIGSKDYDKRKLHVKICGACEGMRSAAMLLVNRCCPARRLWVCDVGNYVQRLPLVGEIGDDYNDHTTVPASRALKGYKSVVIGVDPGFDLRSTHIPWVTS